MQTLLALSIAMLAGLMMSRLTKVWNLPAVTAYLVAGILIGPYCLGQLGIPGLGSAGVDALNNSDLQLLKALVLFSAILFIIFNFAADFLYALVDPRVKVE